MNCFNIREIQTLLRSKYHPDSLSVIEHHQFLNDTVIGLRYQLGGLETIDPSMASAFNYGLVSLPVDRDQQYYLELEYTCSSYSSYLFYSFVNKFYNFIARNFYMVYSPISYEDFTIFTNSTSSFAGVS